MRHIRYYVGKVISHNGITPVKLRKAFCVIIAFLISILFVCLALLTTIRWSFSLNTLYRVMDSSNYYSNLLQEMDKNAKIITMPTGLPMEVVDGVFQLQEVRDGVASQLNYIFHKEEIDPDLDIIKTRLKEKVEQYLAKKEVVPDIERSGYINNYINSVANEYRNSLKIPLFDYLYRLSIDHQKLYIIVFAVLVGIILIAMIVLYQLNPLLRKFLFYTYCSTLATALMLAILSLKLVKDKVLSIFHFVPKSLGGLVNDYIVANFHNLFIVSVLFLFLSLILLMIGRVVKIKS